MRDIYTKSMLTVVALALCAIVAKLYLPAANRIGPHLGSPTEGDMVHLASVPQSRRAAAAQQLEMDFPLVRINGAVGVEVDQPIEVRGSVSIDGPVETIP